MGLKITPKMLDVLGVFLERPTERLYGLEIADRLGLASGTLYPILGTLERADLLSSELEEGASQALGRGRRRFYRLTGAGEARTRLAAEEQIMRLQRALGTAGRGRPPLKARKALQ